MNAEFKRSHAIAIQEMQEMRKFQAKSSREMVELRNSLSQTEKMIGGMGNSNGAMAQEFFFNAIFFGKRKLFGQEFDDAMPEVRKYFKKGG